MSLVKRTFKLSDAIDFECWIVSIDDGGTEKYYFKGHDAGSALGYVRPNNAILDHVKPKYKQTLSKLVDTLLPGTLQIPKGWMPHMIFISEPGLYSLISHSEMEYAQIFMDWVFEEVLPSLRREGQYKMREKEKNELTNGLLEANKALVLANNELILARQEVEKNNKSLILANDNLAIAHRDLVKLSHRIANMTRDVVVKPKSEELLHTLTIHKTEKNEFIFTRCQKRSLQQTLKRLAVKNPDAIEFYSCSYTPNGVNVLNCFKDRLCENQIPYSSKHNIIRILKDMDKEEILSLIPRRNV